LYRVALRNLFGPAFPLVSAPASAMLERLLLVQGYLPSGYSPSIRTMLRKERASGAATLHLSAESNPQTRPALGRIVRKLRHNRRSLRALPIGPMLRPGKPGRGFHSGGTFPMRETPGPLETDRQGRPHGFARVHAVDSTVFPSIPATTITLSVMAN